MAHFNPVELRICLIRPRCTVQVNFSNRGIASLILEVLIFKCKLKDYRYNSLSTIFQKIFFKSKSLCVDHVTQQMARSCSAAWSMKYGSKRFSGWGGWER